MPNTQCVEIWIQAAEAEQVTFNSALVNACDNPHQGIVDALDRKMARLIKSTNYPQWIHENPEEGAAILAYMKVNDRAIQELERGYRNINSPCHPQLSLDTSFKSPQHAQYRPNTELCPADLKFTMSPEETEGWEVQFKSYISTSLMEMIPIADQ